MIVTARHFDNLDVIEAQHFLGHARVQVHCRTGAVDCLAHTELTVIISTKGVHFTVLSQH